MSTHTIELSGISDELLRRLDAKVRERNAPGRSAYILDLVVRDTEPAAGQQGATESISRFQDLLAPVQAETDRLGFTEEEIDASVEEARQEYWKERSENLLAQNS